MRASCTGHPAFRWLPLFLLLWGGFGPARAADHFVILGSGGVPSAQEASIFEVASFWDAALARRYRSRQWSVLFGAGNRPGRKAYYADVRVERDAPDGPGEPGLHESLEPGRLRRNRPATTGNLEELLRDHLAKPGELWLLAHGHGSPNQDLPAFRPDRYDDNRLLLWRAEAGLHQLPDEPAPFTVPDLRRLLDAPQRRADFVFLITSCYSGGFHQAVVGDDAGRPIIRRGAAGFTAAPEDLPSAGCTTTPDFWQDTYVGLFARSFINGNPTGKQPQKARLRLADAHREAVLSLPEWSFEIPLATSDHYLGRWAATLFSEHPGHRALWGDHRDAAQRAFRLAWHREPANAPAEWKAHRKWVEAVVARTAGLDQARRRNALADPESARRMQDELFQRHRVADQILEDADRELSAAAPGMAEAWQRHLPKALAAARAGKAFPEEIAWEPECAAAEAADPDPRFWSDALFDRHSHLAAVEPRRFEALGRWLARRAALRDDWIADVLAGGSTVTPADLAALTGWRNRTIQQVEAERAATKAETEWAAYRRAVTYLEVSATWHALRAAPLPRALADLAELHRLETLSLPPPGRK